MRSHARLDRVQGGDCGPHCEAMTDWHGTGPSGHLAGVSPILLELFQVIRHEVRGRLEVLNLNVALLKRSLPNRVSRNDNIRRLFEFIDEDIRDVVSSVEAMRSLLTPKFPEVQLVSLHEITDAATSTVNYLAATVNVELRRKGETTFTYPLALIEYALITLFVSILKSFRRNTLKEERFVDIVINSTAEAATVEIQFRPNDFKERLYLRIGLNAANLPVTGGTTFASSFYLTIAQRILGRLGGSITIAAGDDLGCVTITLPAPGAKL